MPDSCSKGCAQGGIRKRPWELRKLISKTVLYGAQLSKYARRIALLSISNQFRVTLLVYPTRKVITLRHSTWCAVVHILICIHQIIELEHFTLRLHRNYASRECPRVQTWLFSTRHQKSMRLLEYIVVDRCRRLSTVTVIKQSTFPFALSGVTWYLHSVGKNVTAWNLHTTLPSIALVQVIHKNLVHSNTYWFTNDQLVICNSSLMPSTGNLVS